VAGGCGKQGQVRTGEPGKRGSAATRRKLLLATLVAQFIHGEPPSTRDAAPLKKKGKQSKAKKEALSHCSKMRTIIMPKSVPGSWEGSEEGKDESNAIDAVKAPKRRGRLSGLGKHLVHSVGR